MNLAELENNFGTEKQCLDYLFILRWENGYKCPRCKYNEMWQIQDYKYKCKKCGYQTTVTAGTLFQDSHIPMTVWFRAIWYYTSSGEKMTVSKLQEYLGLGSNRTALNIMKKLKYAVPIVELDKLSGTVEINRRMINNKNNRFALAAAVEINNKTIGKIRLGVTDSIYSDDIIAFVENCVERDSTVIGKIPIKIKDKGFKYQQMSDLYCFPYANKIIDKIQVQLSNSNFNGNINEYIDNYCANINKLKTTVSFDELLYSAIHMPPMIK